MILDPYDIVSVTQYINMIFKHPVKKNVVLVRLELRTVIHWE